MPELQSLRIEEADSRRDQLDLRIVGIDGLAVHIDDGGLVAPDAELSAPHMTDELRIVRIASLLVSADNARHLKQRDLLTSSTSSSPSSGSASGTGLKPPPYQRPLQMQIIVCSASTVSASSSVTT